MNINFLQSLREKMPARSNSQSHVYDSILQWLIVISAFLPVFFLPWTTNVLEYNKQLFLILLTGVALIVWLLQAVISNRITLRLNPIDYGVLAMLGATLIATVGSASRMTSLFGAGTNLSSSLISIIVLSLFYFILLNASNDNGKRFSRFLGLVLGISFLIGLLQFFTIYILGIDFTHSRAFNTIGSINSLGILAAISLPFLFKSQERGFWKISHRVAAMIGLVLIAIINWWLIWVVAIAGMLAMICLASVQKNFKISKVLLPIVVIVLGVFLLIIKFNVESVKSQFPVEIAPSFSLSNKVMNSTLKYDFFTGYGPENFSLAFDKYGADRLATTTLSSAKFFDATSEFFTLVVSGGILALLGLAVLIWSLVRGAYRYIDSPGESAGKEGILASLATIIFALFLYPFSMTHMFVLYAFLALSATTLWGKEEKTWQLEEKPALSLASTVGFVGGLVLVLVGVYFSVSAYIANAYYATTLKEGNTGLAAQKISSVINWDSRTDTYYRGASQVALRLLSDELNKKADPKDTGRNDRIQRYLSSSVNLAKRAVELNPKEAVNWDNLGDVYQSLFGLVEGVDGEAEKAYIHASELRPGDPEYFNKIGTMYLRKADVLRQLALQQNSSSLVRQADESLVKSEASFKKAIEKSPNYGMAIYNLGVVYEREGKVRESIQQLEKIAPFNANQPSLMFELGLLYYRNGEKDKALGTLERAVSLAPDYANALWYLGLLYEERGDTQAAITQMQKILKIEVNKGNKTVLNKIDQLRSGSKAQGKITDQKPL